MYMFLGDIFIDKPDYKYLNLIVRKKYLEDFPFSSNKDIKKGIDLLIESIVKLDGTNNIQILSWDYNRLFIGPSEILAPPRMSAYRDSKGLEETFKKYGYLPKNLKLGVDHISNLFDFMSRLSVRSIEYLDDYNKTMEIIQDQKIFFENYINSWICRFIENIEKYHRTDYFMGTAFLLNGYITAESDNLHRLYNLNK